MLSLTKRYFIYIHLFSSPVILFFCFFLSSNKTFMQRQNNKPNQNDSSKWNSFILFCRQIFGFFGADNENPIPKDSLIVSRNFIFLVFGLMLKFPRKMAGKDTQSNERTVVREWIFLGKRHKPLTTTRPPKKSQGLWIYDKRQKDVINGIITWTKNDVNLTTRILFL